MLLYLRSRFAQFFLFSHGLIFNYQGDDDFCILPCADNGIFCHFLLLRLITDKKDYTILQSVQMQHRLRHTSQIISHTHTCCIILNEIYICFVITCKKFPLYPFLFLTLTHEQKLNERTNERTKKNRRLENTGVHWGGAAHPGYFKAESATPEQNLFHFAMVTDLDQLSLMESSSPSKPKFYSKILPATLRYNPKPANTYTIGFDPKDIRILTSAHNEAGRGMELSELTLYQDRLLTFDDRTGCVFEILSEPESNGQSSLVVPRFVITEGEGDTDKGMKWEWATVKGDTLYIGSMGKEYTNKDGSIANTNNLWIATINPTGEVTRIDWVEQYDFVRKALGAEAPGYVIHEAVLWSEHLSKWIFVPRRISSKMYNEFDDEKMGANKLILVNEDFTSSTVIDIKFNNFLNDGLHGFSTLAFVPGTSDQHALALRSVEEDCVGGDGLVCKQRSYATVFDIMTGDMLMDEVEIGLGVKFEGVEFVDIRTPSPNYQIS